MSTFSWQPTTGDPAQACGDVARPATTEASLVRGAVPHWQHEHTGSGGGGSSSGRGSGVASAFDALSTRRISTPDGHVAAAQQRTQVDPNMPWMQRPEPQPRRPSSARAGSSYHVRDSGAVRGVQAGEKWAGRTAGLHEPAPASSFTSLPAGAPPQATRSATDAHGIDGEDNEARMNSLETIWGYSLPPRLHSGASSAAGESQTSSPTVVDRDRRPSGLENVPRHPSRTAHSVPQRRSSVDARASVCQEDASRFFLAEGSTSLLEAATPPTHSWVPLPVDTLLVSGTVAAGGEDDEDAELQAVIDAATARFQDLSSEEEEEGSRGLVGTHARRAQAHSSTLHPFFGSAVNSSTSSRRGKDDRSLHGAAAAAAAMLRDVGGSGAPSLSNPLTPTYAQEGAIAADGARHFAPAARTTGASVCDGTHTPTSLEACGSDSLYSPRYNPSLSGTSGALLRAGSGQALDTATPNASVGFQPPVVKAGGIAAAAAAAAAAGESSTMGNVASSSLQALPPHTSWCSTSQPSPTTAASPTNTLAGMSNSRRPSAAPHSGSFSGTSFTSPPISALQIVSPPQDSASGAAWRGAAMDAPAPPHLQPCSSGSRGVQRHEEAASVLCVSPPPTSIAAASRGGRGGYMVDATHHHSSPVAAVAVAARATAVNSLLSSPSAPSFQAYHMPPATILSEHQHQQQQQHQPQGSPHMMLYSPPQVYMSAAAAAAAATGAPSLSNAAASAAPLARLPPAAPTQHPPQQQQQQIVAGSTLTPSVSSSAAAAAATSSIHSSRASRNLYFRNLPRSWNTTVLRELCSGYGAVMSAKVAHHPTTNESLGYGFVLFESTACAAVCVATLNQALVKTEGEETRTLLVRMAHASAVPGFQEDPEEAVIAAGGRSEAHALAAAPLPPVPGQQRRGSLHSPAVYPAPSAAAGALDGTIRAASVMSSPHSRENSFATGRVLSPASLTISGGDAVMPVHGDPRQLTLHVAATSAGALHGEVHSLNSTSMSRPGYPSSPLLQETAAQTGMTSRLPPPPHVPTSPPALHDGALATAATALSASLHRVPSGAALAATFPGSPQQQQQQIVSGRGGGSQMGAALSVTIAINSLSLSPTNESSPLSPSSDAVSGSHTATSARNVYVTNLPLAWNTARLRDACAPFGAIISASVAHHPATNESRGYGFVLFSDAKDAAACVAALHQLHVPDTPNVLVCRFAKEKATPSIAHVMAAASPSAATATESAKASLRVSGGTSPLVTDGSTFSGSDTQRITSAGVGRVSDAVLMPIDVFSTLQERVYVQCLQHMLRPQQQAQERDGDHGAPYWAKATTPLGLITALSTEQQSELERRMRQCVVYGSYVPGQGSAAEAAAISPHYSPLRQPSPSTTSSVHVPREVQYSVGTGSAGVVCCFALPVTDAPRSPSTSLSFASAAEVARPARESSRCHTPSNETASSRAASTSPHSGTPLHVGGGNASSNTAARGARGERWWYTCTLFTSPAAAESFMKEAADEAAKARRSDATGPSFEDALASSPAGMAGGSVEGRSLLTRYGRCERVLVFRGDHAPLGASEGRTPPSASTGGTPTSREAAGTTPPRQQAQSRTAPPPPQPRSLQALSSLHPDATAAATGMNAGTFGAAAAVPAYADGRGGVPDRWLAAAASTAPVPPRPRSATLLPAPALPLHLPLEERFPSFLVHGGAAEVVQHAAGQRESYTSSSAQGADAVHVPAGTTFTTYSLHSPPTATGLSLWPSTAGEACVLPYGGDAGGVAAAASVAMHPAPNSSSNSSISSNCSSTAVPPLRRTSPASAAVVPSVHHSSSSGVSGATPPTAVAYSPAVVGGRQGGAAVSSVPAPFTTPAAAAAVPAQGYTFSPNGLPPSQNYHHLHGAAPHS